jgi:hypothetical protein
MTNIDRSPDIAQTFMAEQFPAGAIRNYAVLSLAAAAMVALWLLFMGYHAVLALIPLGISIGGVLKQIRFAGAAMLGLMLFILAIRPSYIPAAFDQVNFMKWLGGLAVMAFLIAYSRYYSSSTRRQTLENKDDHDAFARRKIESSTTAEYWDVLIWGMGSMLASFGILTMTPRMLPTGIVRYMRANDIKTVETVLMIGIAVAMALGFFSLRSWYGLTSREAGVYLRSVAWRWNGRELEALEKYTAKKNRPGKG